MGQTIPESNTGRRGLVFNFLVILTASVSIARATAIAWREEGLIRYLIRFLASYPFLNEQQLGFFVVGVLITLFVLLSLDPMNSASAFLLLVASLMYIFVLHGEGLLFIGENMLGMEDLYGGALVLLGGVCVTLILVKAHKGFSHGVFDWNRRFVRLIIAAIMAGVTAFVTVDYLLNGQVRGVVVSLVPPVMFIYLVAHGLVEHVERSIVVLGPRRNGKTTFLVGLYHAYLETDDEDSDSGNPSSFRRLIDSSSLPAPFSKLKKYMIRIIIYFVFGEDNFGTLKSGIVWPYVALRSLVAGFRQNGPTYGFSTTTPLRKMRKALVREEDGWGTYTLDRPLELGEPLPRRMYVKVGFEVVSSEVFTRRVRLQTIDFSGDHYNDLPQRIEEYRGLSGRVRRFLAWVRGTDLDEYGEYEDEGRFERILARKVLSADAIVLVLEADHLVNGISEGTSPKVSTNDYNSKMVELLEKLEDIGPSREVSLVVTKVDRLRAQRDVSSWSDLEETVQKMLKENEQLSEFYKAVDKYSIDIHPVCFGMRDEESGGVKSPETEGFEVALESLVPAYE